MSVTRLAIFAWILVILQVFNADAKIDPKNYYIDTLTGLRRLRINLKELSSNDQDEVRAITVSGKDAQRYCKFSGISPGIKWYEKILTTLQPAYWCFDQRSETSNICCEDEGFCICPIKNRYNCYCTGPPDSNSTTDKHLSLRFFDKFAETA